MEPPLFFSISLLRFVGCNGPAPSYISTPVPPDAPDAAPDAASAAAQEVESDGHAGAGRLYDMPRPERMRPGFRNRSCLHFMFIIRITLLWLQEEGWGQARCQVTQQQLEEDVTIM